MPNKTKENNKDQTKEKQEKHDEQREKSFFKKSTRTQDYSEARERMCNRGEEYVETYLWSTTQIKIEFNVKAGTTLDV
eukprot:scaffold61174_cov65-Attheya_sp.AAC.1